MEFNATFIVTIISFLVFVFLMNTLLYRPIENIVEERKKLIEGNYNEADSANSQARSLLEEKADKIAKSKIEAKQFIDTKLKEGYSESTEIIRNARTKSVEFLQFQKQELKNQSEQIEQNFDVTNLVQSVKDKILGGAHD